MASEHRWGLVDQCDALLARVAELEAALLSQRQATDEAMRRAEEARRDGAGAWELAERCAQKAARLETCARCEALAKDGQEVDLALRRGRGIYYRALQRIAVADDDAAGWWLAEVAKRALDGQE